MPYCIGVPFDDMNTLAISPDPDGGVIRARHNLTRRQAHHALHCSLMAFQDMDTLVVPPYTQ